MVQAPCRYERHLVTAAQYDTVFTMLLCIIQCFIGFFKEAAAVWIAFVIDGGSQTQCEMTDTFSSFEFICFKRVADLLCYRDRIGMREYHSKPDPVSILWKRNQRLWERIFSGQKGSEDVLFSLHRTSGIRIHAYDVMKFWKKMFKDKIRKWTFGQREGIL